LAGEERHEAVRPGLDLDLRRDAVFDDARDDAGKAIAGRLPDGDLASARLREERKRRAVDEALPAGAADCDQSPVVHHPPHRVDTDTECLGCLAEPITRHCAENPSRRERTAPLATKLRHPSCGPSLSRRLPPPSRPTVE